MTKYKTFKISDIKEPVLFYYYAGFPVQEICRMFKISLYTFYERIIKPDKENSNV